MSKLTQKDEQGNWCIRGLPWRDIYPGAVITRNTYERIYGVSQKLMEYEDTGLTPDEINALRERDIKSEEDITKFYYCESEDDYYIGKRVENLYYAKYGPEDFTWFMSRYLPWGQHIVAPETAWKEYTFPSEPKEIPFTEWLDGFIRKHMSGKDSNIPANDGWIPVEERLPEKNEYFVDTSSNKDFPNGYYRRLEIAYMTDTIEYVHGYYDGYKWMDKYLNAIKNVVAWRIHEPYQPETEAQRPGWQERLLHTFLGGHV